MFWKFFSLIIYYLFSFFGGREPLDVAFISNCRDTTDRRRIGNPKYFIPWTVYFWKGIKGRLYMISSTTDEIGGSTAVPGSIKLACERFEAAVNHAVKHGARVILYAAGTKRLPIWKMMREKYPRVVFTLGDNFTGALLGGNIKQGMVICKSSNPRVLLIAPYGLLGTAACIMLAGVKCEVIVLGNPDIEERVDSLKEISDKYGFLIASNFETIGKVDLVIACNCAPWAQLTPERIDLIRYRGRKLIVVDPCEPANLKRRVWEIVSDRVIRLDSGNGYSQELKNVLSPIAWRINRMAEHLIWGCFAEAMIIAKYLEFNPSWFKEDWYDVTPEHLNLMSQYLNSDFTLPKPTNFSKLIPNKTFEIDIVEPPAYELDLDV